MPNILKKTLSYLLAGSFCFFALNIYSILVSQSAMASSARYFLVWTLLTTITAVAYALLGYQPGRRRQVIALFVFGNAAVNATALLLMHIVRAGDGNFLGLASMLVPAVYATYRAWLDMTRPSASPLK